MLAEMYSEAIVRSLLDRMTGTDPVRYRLIRPDLAEKELGKFIDAVARRKLIWQRDRVIWRNRKRRKRKKFHRGIPMLLCFGRKSPAFAMITEQQNAFCQNVFSSGEADAPGI